jgi:hypothetical protein
MRVLPCKIKKFIEERFYFRKQELKVEKNKRVELKGL